MMERFEFTYLIVICRLVEISDAHKFSLLSKPTYDMKLSHFIYHLIVACSEKNAPQMIEPS